MSKEPFATLDSQLCFALYAASNAMTRLYRDKLEPLGLTYSQYLVMLVLWEQDAITVKQLGGKLFLDSGTLTPMLKRMASAGMIRRERSSSDERQVLLYLTPLGKALQQQVRLAQRELACLLPLDYGAFVRLRTELRGLAENLQAAARAPE